MRIITRTVFILSLVSLFADIASEMLYPIIPVYLKEIGFTVLWIGILEGVANFTAGISKGYFGKLSDEKGRRLPFVRIGYLLSSLSKPLMVVSVYPLWIFFVRTVDRLGKGVRTAARDALLSQEATKATKARVFGFHRSMDTLGATIGPVLALLFLFFYPGNYRVLFLAAFVPGLISIFLVFLVREKQAVVSTTLGKGNFFSYLKYWKIAPPEFKKLVSGILLLTLFNSSDIFLLLKTAEVLKDSTIVIGNVPFNTGQMTVAAYILYNLVFAVMAYPMGSLADKFGIRNIFLFGLLLFIIVYAGFAFDPSPLVIFILFIIYGIYAAATEGIVKAWISNYAHEKKYSNCNWIFYIR